MYWAVQSPMPGSWRRAARVASTSALADRSSWPPSTARASATMAAWRWRTMPSWPSASPSAAANTAGVGNSLSSPGQGVSTGAPNCRTRRSARVRAAATVICWPSTARTASSKPSSVPGTRRPSPLGKKGCSTALMAAGSASRSSRARTRAITWGSAGSRPSLTRSSSWGRVSSKRASSQPVCTPAPPASRSVRRRVLPSTSSRP